MTKRLQQKKNCILFFDIIKNDFFKNINNERRVIYRYDFSTFCILLLPFSFRKNPRQMYVDGTIKDFCVTKNIEISNRYRDEVFYLFP